MKFIGLVIFTFFCSMTHAALNSNAVCTQSGLNIPEGECRILLKFYQDNNGHAWDTKTSWGGADVNSWKGLEVDGGHVVVIDANFPSQDGAPLLTGLLPIEFHKLINLRKLDLSGNKFEGAIPLEYRELINLQVLALTSNNLTSNIPEIFGNMTQLRDVYLNRNRLSGRVPSGFAESAWLRIDFNWNLLTGTIPSSLGDLKNLVELNLGRNMLSGAIPSSLGDLEHLQKIDISQNRLHGEVPQSFSNLHSIISIDLSHNFFLWGELTKWLHGLPRLRDLNLFANQFWIRDISLFNNFPRLGHANLSGNHIAGDLSTIPDKISQYYSENNFYQSMIEGQVESLKNVSVEVDSHGMAVMTPNIEAVGTKVFIVPDDGYRLLLADGCPGTYKQSIFTISDGSENCTLSITFKACDGAQCVVNFGATSNVPNVSVETPSTVRVLSGVAQLRGWLNDSVWSENLFWDVPVVRAVWVQIDDGEKLYKRQNQYREDVIRAMGLDSQGYSEKHNSAYFSWGFLLYSGLLDNGNHRLRLYNRAGVLVEDFTFEVFNPTVNSDVKYLSGVEKTLMVNNFPILSHKTKIKFNQAQQNFTIEDQFDENGVSLTSNVRYYNEVEVLKSKFYADNSVSRIENPADNMVFSGVQSLRGWFLLPDEEVEYNNDSHSLSIDDGDLKVDVALLDFREKRQDVSKRYGHSKHEYNGWSVVGYSGHFKNGWHRARLQWKSQYKSEVYTYSESIFKAFTPLNEFGEQFYVRSYDKDIIVEDFPYKGSDVILRFDPAGQSFTMVSQTVH